MDIVITAEELENMKQKTFIKLFLLLQASVGVITDKGALIETAEEAWDCAEDATTENQTVL
jgi:hypothetical protein